MRSTIERKPFERCGVRCSRKPSFSNSATASVRQNVLARLCRNRSRTGSAISPRTMCASLSPIECQHRAARAIRTHVGVEPDLARASLHLVGVAVRRRRKRRQFPPQFDQIAVAVVPVVEDREIVDDFVDVGHRAGVPRRPYIERRGRGRSTLSRLECCAANRGYAVCLASLRGSRPAPCAARGRRASACSARPFDAGLVRAALAVLARCATATPVSCDASALGQEFVKHLGAGLRPVADRGRDLRADRAGVGLACRRSRADRRRSRMRPKSLRWRRPRCRRLRGCEEPLGNRISTRPSQNAIRNRKNM